MCAFVWQLWYDLIANNLYKENVTVIICQTAYMQLGEKFFGIFGAKVYPMNCVSSGKFVGVAHYTIAY